MPASERSAGRAEAPRSRSLRQPQLGSAASSATRSCSACGGRSHGGQVGSLLGLPRSCRMGKCNTQVAAQLAMRQ